MSYDIFSDRGPSPNYYSEKSAMYSSPCRQCDATGYDAMTSVSNCDCECHLGLDKVSRLYESKQIDLNTADMLMKGIMGGHGYCKGCRENHKCGVCDGAGEVNS